jgi:hypothetical protein
MNTTFKAFLTTAILAITGATAGAAVIPQSKTVVVESPANFPALAQVNAEAMYLHDTNNGRTILYIEAQNGQQLTALDVTNPARIQQVAQTAIPATSAFDFARPVGDEGELIRYRNGSGVALISFRNYKHPILVAAATLDSAVDPETLGRTAMLIPAEEAAIRPISNPRSYRVVDTSDISQPGLLATVPTVTQSLSKPDTGTLFLLNQSGVTVVRRLRVEEAHQMELDQQRGN